MVAVFEAPGDSDHTPCVFDFVVEAERRKSSFRCFSFLSTHPRFLSDMGGEYFDRIKDVLFQAEI